MPRTFAAVFLLNLIASTSLALLLGPRANWQYGLHVGLCVGATFVGTALGITYLFELRPLRLFFINAAYQTIVFAAMGLILGSWH